METFDVAHIREQGTDLIIVLVSSSFGRMTATQQSAAQIQLQACATQAGLAGTVVPVWDAGFGRMGFRAPHQWHPFFSSIDAYFIAANINRRLTCG